MVTFKIEKVWNLGATIHIIGTIENGSISPGSVLQDAADPALLLNVSSVTLGGKVNLPEGAVTLVVDKLPCEPERLNGRVFHKH